MNRDQRLCTSLLALLMTAGLAWADEAADSKVEVELLAEHTALVPGQSTTLAISFKIPSEWHIYWQNRGEGGLEPKFTWHLPEGYTAGPVRYPSPILHIDENGEQTFTLEGEPVLLAPLNVPASAKPGEEAKLGLDAEWLVCKKLCVRGEKPLSIKLPVVADAKDAKESDPLTFKVARAELPVAGDKPGKYIRSISAKASVDKIPPGGEFQVAITVEMQPDYHIKAHDPMNKDMIPTHLFPYRAAGLTFGRPQYPKGEIEKPAPDVKEAVYRKTVTFTLPVTASGVVKAESIDIGGVITYQSCSDVSKMCFPPGAVEWHLKLPVAAAGDKVKVSQITTPDSEGYERGFVGRIQDSLLSRGVAGYLLLALIGGFILNFMPCVLPVISIKVLSFVQQSKASRLRVLTLGLAFAAGILVSFVVLGLLILGLLKGLGLNQVEWGGLFQKPEIVIILASVVTAMALSLFGVFTLGPPQFVNHLGGRVRQEGHLGAFGTGLLATILGTACTAPFLSAVIAAAVRQPPAIALLIFAFTGMGMAFPYVILAAVPAWVKLIPRPGPWMTTFEHIMGFLMLGTVIWLLNPLAHQLGTDGLIWVLAFLLLVALAAWCYGRVEFGARPVRRFAYYGAAVAILVVGWMFCLAKPEPELIAWVPYTSRQVAEDLSREGKTIFVDYTAAWCVNCKSNERLVLNTKEVSSAIERLGVVPMKADYTAFDKRIADDLKRFNRSGVPMYVVIPANKPDAPILLNEILTQSAVLDALEKAAAGTKPEISVAATER